MERIINIECGYLDEAAKIIYKTEDNKRAETKEPFYPFIWAKRSTCTSLCNGDRPKIQQLLNKYGIGVKALTTHYDGYEVAERMEKGYTHMFYALNPMSYNKFLKFFEEAEQPVFKNNNNNNQPQTTAKQYLAVSPVEQFMMQTGKRLFKGYDDYDELTRMEFDLETEGLDPKRHRINQIGIRTNKGFEKLIAIGDEKDDEVRGIIEFFEIIAQHEPDVIIGYNSENFDWDFIITRLEILGFSIETISKRYFGNSIYKKKKPTALKLGGEMEYFRQTIVPGYNIIDGLHAVRRAQAIDSNMQKAGLKYVTQYIKANKSNRVYISGDKIKELWGDTVKDYAFNNNNGDWYKTTIEKPVKEEYELVTGTYIAERYLMDDLFETDAVELRFNQANFLVSKLLATTFGRACTMGNSAIWRMIILTFSYENNIAIPAEGKKQRFTGGLSRLLSVGFVPNVVKLDYGSLYPSIILTWAVKTDLDIPEILLIFVEYILSEREKYKGLKKKAGKKVESLEKELSEIIEDEKEIKRLKKEILKWEGEESKNDKQQLPLKILANSFFGSYGSPDIFNWGDVLCAEKTTCIGRQCLRLMIYVFNKWGYKPIVGDSVTADTPLYIKDKKTGQILIKQIKDIFNSEEYGIDELGREYDISPKPYMVLCRSGWVDVNYVYRHKTDKKIRRIRTENGYVDVTEDHSLFNEDKEKINPKNIQIGEKIEIYG
jgi:DNA polymerase elongation subunit (family B)